MSLIGKFASVGSATMASRVLGFVREAMIAAFLGAGPVADAFYAAFRFPNLFRRLFAEGAFNAAFVPLFAKEIEGGGQQAAKRFAEQVLSVLVATLLTLSALAMIFMPFLVGHGDRPEIRRGSGQVRSHRAAGAHHVSLSRGHEPGRDAGGHPQFAAALLSRSACAGSAQCRARLGT
jgi:hypothetical protein